MTRQVIEGMREPGSAASKPAGWRSSSPIMLLSCMPVPGMNSPDPDPLEAVIDATLPQRSITERWVVP